MTSINDFRFTHIPKDKHGWNIYVLRVTPEIAGQMLSTVTNKNGDIDNYRKAKSPVIDSYREVMENDMWEDSPVPIVFDNKGRLVDGQHRLFACVASGKSITVLVVEGVKPSIVDVVFDNGLLRKLDDVYRRQGEDDARELALAIRFIWLRTVKSQKVRGGGKLPVAKALELGKEHPALGESIAYIIDTNEQNNGQLRRCVSLGLLAGLHYLFRNSGVAGADAKADKFVKALAMDDKLTQNKIYQPALALHKLLTGQKDKEHRLTRDGIVGVCIKAWLAFVAGESVNRLSVSKDEFPRIGGLDVEPEVEEEEEIDEVVQEEMNENDEAPAKPKRKPRKKKVAPEVEQAEADAAADNDGGE